MPKNTPQCSPLSSATLGSSLVLQSVLAPSDCELACVNLPDVPLLTSPPIVSTPLVATSCGSIPRSQAALLPLEEAAPFHPTDGWAVSFWRESACLGRDDYGSLCDLDVKSITRAFLHPAGVGPMSGLTIVRMVPP
jgi:hypothetical protein